MLSACAVMQLGVARVEPQGALALKDLYRWVGGIMSGIEMCPDFFGSSAGLLSHSV